MELTSEQREKLKRLMVNSARKGNLANSGMVLENGQEIASAESWVVSDHNATAHSERMLVEQVGRMKGSNFTPGLVMISVVEPCVMCMSAYSQAGYAQICYIVPAYKYVQKIPWVTDGIDIDKEKLASQFSNPIELVRLGQYEEEFSEVFVQEMEKLLNIKL